jgi:hypothetical protein
MHFGTIVGATKADALPIFPMMPLTTHAPLEKMKQQPQAPEAPKENPVVPTETIRNQAPPEKLPFLRKTEIAPLNAAKEVPFQEEQSPEKASVTEASSQERVLQKEQRATQQEKTETIFQKRSTENQSQDFFVKRKKYETEGQYYAKFQKFATQTLGLLESASYDEIKRNGRIWRQKNTERTGAQDTFAFLKMTKSLDELKRYQRAQQEKEVEQNSNQEQSDRQEEIQIKAKALSKLWEKIIATEVEKDQEKGIENAYDIFEGILNKKLNTYEKEERVLLVDVLKAEGIVLVLKNDATIFGETQWILDVDAMEKLRQAA